MTLSLALTALMLALAAAAWRPHWAPEALVAAVGAVLLLAVGAIAATTVGTTLRELGSTVGFLAALLVLADGCRRAGLFDAIGAELSRRSAGRPRRLLALVFLAASLTTIVLGLDATVVLLTPVVALSLRGSAEDPRPPLYACAHLANSASLLLPVSNLTNLLAFRASGLSFLHFAELMALPTAAVVAVEWVVLSRLVGRGSAPPQRDSKPPPSPPAAADVLPRRPLPTGALVIVAATLAGFAASSALGINPVWVAVAGAVAITVPALISKATTPALLARAAQPGFLVFVLALGVIVAAAGRHGLTDAVRAVLPSGGSLGDLILVTLIAATLANVVNNLPATLILVPVAATLGPDSVLAVLVGVNVGPNLTEVGSLATLLWRRAVAASGIEMRRREFALLGLISVPPALVAGAALLWVASRLI
jgi:arsenical pump membrane protein